MLISERQLQLLNAIISEYLDTAEPVGSVELVGKYKFDFSPATARNEMAKLIDLGYLQMLHTSSGRIPTPMAYRYFLQEMVEETEIPVLQEVAVKQRLWPYRFEFEKLLKKSVQALSDQVKEAAFAVTNEGFIHLSGAVNILDHKEFWDIEVARTALHTLDTVEILQEIFNKAYSLGEVKCAIGEEINVNGLEQSAFVFSNYNVGKNSGYIGVFGPARINYENIIPAIKYTGTLLEDLGSSW